MREIKDIGGGSIVWRQKDGQSASSETTNKSKTVK